MASFLDTIRNRPAVAPQRPDIPNWPTPGTPQTPSPPALPTGGRPMAQGSPFATPGYRPPSGWRFGDPVPHPQTPQSSNPAVTPPPAPAPGATDPFGGRPAQLFKTQFQDALLGTGYVPPAVLQEIMAYWDTHQVGGPVNPLNQASIGSYGQGLSADALAILKKAFGGIDTPAQQMAKLAPEWWASLQPGYQQTPNWTSAGVPTNAAAVAYDKENGARPWGDVGQATAAQAAANTPPPPTFPDGTPIPPVPAPPPGAPQNPTPEQYASHPGNTGYWQFNAASGQWEWVPYPAGSGG